MFKRIKKIAFAVLAVVLVVMLVFGLYAGSYYHADMEAINRMALETVYADVEVLSDGTMVFYPGEYTAGMIFYPGGKVEFLSYIPLMEYCAQEGILCVLVQMPFNLAVMNPDAADGVREQFPEVEHWYMAGHSLGGARAADYAAGSQGIDGLILLAAYSAEDVSNIPVLSIYGSEDGVLDREKYEKYRENLPADYTEVILEGGNHAGFGVYGPQDGDGDAAISNAEQIEQTARLIAAFAK